MKAIYKVTNPKIAAAIEAAFKEKGKYMPGLIKKVRKEFPYVLSVGCRKESWTNKIVPTSLLLDLEFIKEEKNFKKEWKECASYLYKREYTSSYWPKVNTNKGRELASKLREMLPTSRDFFQTDELLEMVGYKPKKHIEDIKPNKLIINTLAFGFKRRNGEPTVYFFSGYKGYVPPRGVKEMYISEYNELMK